MHESEVAARLATAERVARDAGALALARFSDLSKLRVEMKGVQDYVSNADREVEALISDALLSAFPGDGMLGEEHGTAGGSGPLWVVDPIDGTGNFVRGFPLFGVSIALVADGVTQVGVIYQPALDRMFTASRYQATTFNGAPAQVRTASSMSDALVIVGFNREQDRAAFFGGLAALVEAGAEFRRHGSASVGLCDVACGRADAFWQVRLSSWDVLAGLLLVERAGGRVNDFLANDGLRSGNATLAVGRGVADELARITKTVLL